VTYTKKLNTNKAVVTPGKYGTKYISKVTLRLQTKRQKIPRMTM
jgi:hypothetical protein